jgi:hypothetical protein
MIEHMDTGESQVKANLRRAASAIDGELASLSNQMVNAEDRDRLRGLLASWARMLEALDLGPAPQIRYCPDCGATAMRAAIRCSNCWSVLTPATAPGET